MQMADRPLSPQSSRSFSAWKTNPNPFAGCQSMTKGALLTLRLVGQKIQNEALPNARSVWNIRVVTVRHLSTLTNWTRLPAAPVVRNDGSAAAYQPLACPGSPTLDGAVIVPCTKVHDGADPSLKAGFESRARCRCAASTCASDLIFKLRA